MKALDKYGEADRGREGERMQVTPSQDTWRQGGRECVGVGVRGYALLVADRLFMCY